MSLITLLRVAVRFRPRRPYKSWWKYIQWRTETMFSIPAKNVSIKTIFRLVKDSKNRKRFKGYLLWCHKMKNGDL